MQSVALGWQEIGMFLLTVGTAGLGAVIKGMRSDINSEREANRKLEATLRSETTEAINQLRAQTQQQHEQIISAVNRLDDRVHELVRKP